MSKILFIGSIQWGKSATGGGAQSKNQHFLKYLIENCDNVNYIDVWGDNVVIALLITWKKILLEKEDTSIIISMSSRFSTYISLFCKILHLRRKLFLWVIGGEFPLIIKNYSKKRRLSLNYYRKVVVQGEYIKKLVELQGINNCEVVHNFKEILYKPEIEKEKKNEFRCVYLSRIIQEKGVDVIIDAIRILNDKNISVDFYGALNEPYSEEFFEEIKKYNIEYKGFLKLDKEEGYRTLAGYDIMLFPTFFKGEGFPGVLIDSFIAGVPVIATDFQVNGEVVQNDVNGFLIPPKDAEALAESIITLKNNPQMLMSLRKNAIDSARKYDVNVVLTETLKKYEII